MNTKEIVIPWADWTTYLADAIDNATDETVIVVQNEAQKELGLGAAVRMGKSVKIEVREET